MSADNSVYQTIYKTQGLNQSDFESGDWRLYEITEEDSAHHAGEVCAIPSQVSVPWASEAYKLEDNGALISTDNTRVIENSLVGAQSIIERRVKIQKGTVAEKVRISEGASVIGSQVGENSTIGAHTTLFASQIGPNTTIKDSDDAGAMINNCNIGSDITIGGNCHLVLTDIEDCSTVGSKTKTGSLIAGADGSRLDVDSGRSHVDSYSVIGDLVIMARGVKLLHDASVENEALIHEGVLVGVGAKVGAAAVVGAGARVENYAAVEPGTQVKSGKHVGITRPRA